MYSSVEDSALPLPWSWVQSLVEEPRSHMPCDMAKKKKKDNLKKILVLSVMNKIMIDQFVFR